MLTNHTVVDENLVILAAKLAHDNNMMISATKLVDESLMNRATEFANENLVNPAIELVHDGETAIRVVNDMVNLAINITDVKFDEELLANDEWLEGMQQKHYIDMMLLGEIEEDNLVATSQVITEIKKTDMELEAKAKKEA